MFSFEFYTKCFRIDHKHYLSSLQSLLMNRYLKISAGRLAVVFLFRVSFEMIDIFKSDFNEIKNKLRISDVVIYPTLNLYIYVYGHRECTHGVISRSDDLLRQKRKRVGERGRKSEGDRTYTYIYLLLINCAERSIGISCIYIYIYGASISS